LKFSTSTDLRYNPIPSNREGFSRPTPYTEI
jgi:hypothetical protein